MKLKLISLILLSLFLIIPVKAQGVVVPIICELRPCLPRPVPRPVPLPNVLPVKSIIINTKIRGQVATTHLEQVFRNDTPYTLEGTYFFPIPENASIEEFAIWENGKKLVGEVRTREEARRIYDEIVRRQRDPGLLEYASKDLFQASIFPIPPNSDKKLEITYTQILKAESGTVAYRYPLGTGKNFWREYPVRNLPPDLPKQKFGTVSGKIEIFTTEPLLTIYSPSHSIEVRRKGENHASVSFETSDNNNDFQLFYGLSKNDFGLSLITFREPAKDGFFLLQVSPKEDIAETELVNKDIVFVLDTSGSMADEGKMEKAREALLFGIRMLRDGDRFNVINFAGEERLFEEKLIPATSEGKRRAEEFVKKLNPSGGTNINDALLASLRQFDTSDRPKMLVFLTDGLPTVGERDVDKIIANVKKIKVDGLRLFAFGVGYDVNTRLLDKLAAENNGTADYVEPKEDLEVKVSNFFAKINSPVLTDLQLDFGDIQTDLMYPRKPGDIFRGTQLTIIGRYKNSAENTTLRLKGKTGRGLKTFSFPNISFPARAEENAFLPRLWAIRRVGWLIEQIRSNGESKELRDEIIGLGLRYGIVTPYTSFLAAEEREYQNFRNESRNMVLRLPEAVSGQSAVTASKAAKAKQSTVTLSEEQDSENSARQKFVRNVNLKTFYLENNVWVDGEFREEAKLPEVKLKFMSPEYFETIRKEKGLAEYFSLGEEVIVVWKGKVYRVMN